MKKILFATTALAAVSLASFANAQESNMMSAAGNTLNIGGYYEFGIASRADDSTADSMGGDTRMYGESELFVDFETTSDRGMTYGVQIDLEIVNGNSTAESGDAHNAEESNIYLIGDFGRVNFGHDDFASDNFLIWAPTYEGAYSQDDSVYGYRYVDHPVVQRALDANNNVRTHPDVDAALNLHPTPGFTNLRYYGNAANYGDSAKITYISPNVGGFKFGASFADGEAGDTEYDLGFGASYSTDLRGLGADASVKVAYAYQTNGETNTDANSDGNLSGPNDTIKEQHSSAGVSFSVDKMTFTGSVYSADAGAVEKLTSEFGAGYDFGGGFRAGYSYAVATAEINRTGAPNVEEEGKFHSLSASYGIAPGLKTTFTYNISDVIATGGQENFKASNDNSEIVWQVEFSF